MSHTSPDNDDIQFALFTTEGTRPNVCRRCHQSFPKDVKLHYMQDIKGILEGRLYCTGCRDYEVEKLARAKNATANSSGTQSGMPAPLVSRQPEEVEIVRQAVAAAAKQKGSNHPVRVSYEVGRVLQQSSAPSTTRNIQPWPLGRKSQGGSNRANQNNALADCKTVVQPIVLPKMAKNITAGETQYGYQEAHKAYEEMRALFRARASSIYHNEVVTLKVIMMVLKPEHKNPQMISNITETIANIPLHIGARDLKAICFVTLLPLFIEWSMDFVTSVDDFTLRTGDRVWLESPGSASETSGAIASLFLKEVGKAKKKIHVLGKVLQINLEIKYDVYLKALAHIQFAQRQAEQPGKMAISYITDNGPSKKRYRSPTVSSPTRGPRARLQPSVQEMPASPSNHHQSKAVARPLPRPLASTSRRPISRRSSQMSRPGGDNLAVAVPLVAKDIRRALEAQVPLSKKNIKSILNSKSIACEIYVTAYDHLEALIESSSSNKTFNCITDNAGVVITTLTYDTKAKPMSGGFKQAVHGQVDSPLFGDRSVIMKQAIYNCAITEKNTIYDVPAQLNKLTMEINCLRWASALMDQVYTFVDGFIEKNGPPPFDIPRTRFVKSALAVHKDEGGKIADVFLLEEVIPGSPDSGFMKFIGNGRARPYCWLEGDHMDCARFLCFCQHMQYVQTGHLAFVGDYQGTLQLLTDPQLLTAPDLGGIFASGNLQDTFEQFPKAHRCEEFCQFFNLRPLTELEEGEIPSSQALVAC